jgi:hypothetical protein
LTAIPLIVLLTIGMLASGPNAGAQQVTKVPRIGVLIPSSAAATAHIVEAFRQGLQDHGYRSGPRVASPDR